MADWLEKNPTHGVDLRKTGLENYPDINSREELDAKIDSLGKQVEQPESFGMKGINYVANNPEDQELLDKLLSTRSYESGHHARSETAKQKKLDRENLSDQ